MFARWVVALDELRRDFRHQRLETDVPAIFLRIDRAMPRDHPTDIARPVASEQESRPRFGLRFERPLDRGHGADKRSALGVAELPEHCRNVIMRTAIELG